MAIDTVYRTGNNVSVTATELFLTTNDGTTTDTDQTDDGVYELWVDGRAALLKGDEFRLRVYEKAHASATRATIVDRRIKGAQTRPTIIKGLVLGVGWNMSLQRISATSRNFYWTIRRIS